MHPYALTDVPATGQGRTAEVDPLVEKPAQSISGIPPRMASHWPSTMGQPLALGTFPSRSCFRQVTIVPL